MLRNLLRQLSPFILLAAILLILSFGLVILFYVILASIVVSLVLYVVNWVQNRFLKRPPKQPKKEQKQGRVIDSDEWRRL